MTPSMLEEAAGKPPANRTDASPAGMTDAAPAGQAAVLEEIIVQSRSRHLNLVFTAAIVAFHVGAIAALFHVTWSAIAVFLTTWFLCQNIGIAVNYHRLLTHRGFLVPRWLEYVMTTLSTMALQGGPIYWVAVHRLHHQLTDRPGDPHSPRDGRWWSHIGWILLGTLHSETKVLDRYAPDLARDRYYRWLNDWSWVPVTLMGAGFAALGHWDWVLWGVFLRVTVGWHVTWLVNSVTHIWGSRRFATRDDSTNNWWVALLTGGEGWHNNHHAHPVSARHGMAWYELDINWYFIQLLRVLGLARKVRATAVDGNTPHFEVQR